MREKIAEFVLVIVAAAAVGIFAYELGKYGYIPPSFLQPIYATIAVVGGYIWVRIFVSILDRVVEPVIGPTKTGGIKNLLYVVAAIIIVAIVSSIFTLNLTGLLVSAGFLGIVLGLAAQQVLGNIFAGLSLLASRPFEIGDRITLANSTYSLIAGTYNRENQFNGFTGVVNDVGLFYTKLKLDDGTPTVVPNSAVLGSLVVNHSKVTLRTVRVRMDLDKKIDFPDFKNRLLDALKKYEIIDSEKSTVESIDIGISTYQVVMIAWARSAFEEPIKTLITQEALKIQKDLTAQLPKMS